jgi:hypothetical protein
MSRAMRPRNTCFHVAHTDFTYQTFIIIIISSSSSSSTSSFIKKHT